MKCCENTALTQRRRDASKEYLGRAPRDFDFQLSGITWEVESAEAVLKKKQLSMA